VDGKRLWAKKFVCYQGVILSEHFPEFYKKPAIIRMPVRVSEQIIDKILDESELGWGNITDLETGCVVYLSKKIGADGIPQYYCDKGKTLPIKIKNWKVFRKKLINILDLSVLADSLVHGKVKVFSYRDDMKEGDVVAIRLLPNPEDIMLPFFNLIWMHFGALENEDDRVWRECGYNVDEAVSKMTISGAASGDLSPGYISHENGSGGTFLDDLENS